MTRENCHNRNFRLKSFIKICLPECHRLHLNPKVWISMESAQRGHGIAIQWSLHNVGTALLLMILNKNASFRNSGTFAYLLLAHIHNINVYAHT